MPPILFVENGAKLYGTQILVKKREIFENLVTYSTYVEISISVLG